MDERVLVVDGDAADAAMAVRVLGARGFVVEVVADAAAAHAAIERQPPDLVLLEVALHGADGMQLLDQLKANPQLAAIPVILVTGRAGDADVLAGYKFGADYLVAKPYTERLLLHGVGLVLGRDLVG